MRRLRAARPDEAEALSALALRSKAHWGYDRTFLAACRDELRLLPGDLAARRVVVAEEDGRVLGLATLDGRPPHGELGMLFVEPAAIRRGVGTLLYRHVLKEAGRLGCTRLAIRSDPHAERFYRSLGARPAPGPRDAGLVPLTAYPPLPEPSWVRAWAGGGRTVHLGNVGEFNTQFEDGAGSGAPGGDHYACLALFAGPDPGLVVLPRAVEPWWVRGLAERLGWGQVQVLSAGADGAGLCASIAASPALRERIRDCGLRVLPWGRTPDLDRLLGGAPADPAAGPDARAATATAVVRRYESKAASHALFRRLAAGFPGIAVPAQQRAASRRGLAGLLAERAAAGATSVVKAEHGVGGSGTWIVAPQDVAAAGGARALARRLPAAARLVEEYVEGCGPCRTPTFDAVVADDGTVHPVGVGAMHVDGTSYGGVTVGPGAVPGTLAATAEAFGTAVGRALAAEGYRGWYDVDFVAGADGRPAPTEINLRLTGPAAAFVIEAALSRLHGGRHLVRALDCLPLGARLPGPALRDHLDRVGRQCAELDAVLLPTIPTAACDPRPWLGAALAARTPAALDAAEALLRTANAELADLFAPSGLTASVPPGSVPPRPSSTRRRARRRSSAAR